MAVPTDMQDTLTGMIFEIAIFVLFLALLTLMWRHYRIRKTRYTKLMFLMFTFFATALLFSWISKAINLYLEAPTFEDINPNMPGYLFLSRILQFRVSFAFITMAIFATQLFKVAVFETKNARRQNMVIGIYSLFVAAYSLIVVVQGNVLYDVLAFLFVTIDLCLVFIPFAVASLKVRKKMTDPIYRKASLALAVMAFAFIFIFVGFLTDRILIMTIRPDGYTFFYYAAWVSAILGSVSAYLGYIRPGQKQKLQEVADANETTETTDESETTESTQG
ncbi:MAG: hypothetical protein ACTSYI_02965 [Promethearchaeota archaeon]